MGGVWIPLHPALAIFWYTTFPPEIQHQVMSTNNPLRVINNSQLELARAIANDAVLLHSAPQPPWALLTSCDNMMAMSWMRKGVVTMDGPVAMLLHLHVNIAQANQFQSHYVHIPGEENEIADLCSPAFHLTDMELLSFLNLCYPLQESWQQCHLPNMIKLWLTSTLSLMTLPWASWLPELDLDIFFGSSGCTSARASKLTLSL